MASAATFLASIGVNTHMDAAGTAYADAQRVAQMLAYIGVKSIRDHAYDTELDAYRTLGAAGVRLDLIVDTDTQHEVETMLPVASLIDTFEGSNEVDWVPVTAPGVSGKVAAAIAVQQRLQNVLRAEPAVAAIPLINESLAFPTNYTKYAGSLPYADIANTHLYAGNGDTPQTYIAPVLQSEVASTSKPTVVTETGYYTLPNNPTDPSGVDESVQARLTLDTLFDNFQLGAAKTYLYELADEGNDPAGDDREQHYGLFHADGTAKPVADALHNLAAILSDPGVSGHGAATLAPSVSGLPATGRWLQLDGKNGSKFIVVWAEPKVWNQATQHELPATTASVSVAFGGSAAEIAVYDPTLGSAPIATQTNASAVTLTITDHPLIVELFPAATTLPTTLAAAPTKAGVAWTDTTSGTAGIDAADAPSGGMSHYAWTVGGDVSLGATTANASLQGGSGTDALHAIAGSNVLDGGAGSSFLVGATGVDGGNDQFFVDGRGASPTWSTIVNFHHGDQVTLWGFQGGVSSERWAANEGASGYLGATLHSSLSGNGPVDASLTLAGLSVADISSKLVQSTGTDAGTNYLRLTFTG